jgi:anthranilate synthase component I
MNFTPDLNAFVRAHRAGKNQTISTVLVSDTETPVSAALKLGQGKPYCFLLESMEGGASRGRYSIIGRAPDLIWRCGTDGKAFVNRDAQKNPDGFTQVSHAPLDDLRALLDECHIDDPNQPQPMAAGLFGYLGYDMVRYMERLPEQKPSGIDVPEALLIRPTLLAIFDQVENKITLVTPVWFAKEQNAETIYAEATARLEAALKDLSQTLPPPVAHKSAAKAEPSANMTEAQFCNNVERAKEYIRAGDIFQVVLSQRFALPFALSPFDLYRAIRRLDPSPFLFFFDFGNFSVVGSSP